MTDTLELILILRIRLYPQAGREHKLANRRTEAG